MPAGMLRPVEVAKKAPVGTGACWRRFAAGQVVCVQSCRLHLLFLLHFLLGGRHAVFGGTGRRRGRVGSRFSCGTAAGAASSLGKGRARESQGSCYDGNQNLSHLRLHFSGADQLIVRRRVLGSLTAVLAKKRPDGVFSCIAAHKSVLVEEKRPKPKRISIASNTLVSFPKRFR